MVRCGIVIKSLTILTIVFYSRSVNGVDIRLSFFFLLGEVVLKYCLVNVHKALKKYIHMNSRYLFKVISSGFFI